MASETREIAEQAPASEPVAVQPTTAIDPSLTPAGWLQREYELRRTRNPYYSQRAFSRLLGISSGRLSEFLSSKRSVTRRVAERISVKLNFSPDTTQRWLGAVESARAKRSRTRRLSALTNDPAHPSIYTPVPEDTIRALADWYHLAILNLMRTRGYRSDIRWIGRRLGLDSSLVRAALTRMERLGLVIRENGEWVRVASPLTSSHEIPSSALREAHRQYLELASASLEAVPLDERDITSITVAIDPARLPLAKRAIRNFRRGLAELLEEGEKKEVYHLNIALFPLSRTRRRQ